MQSVTSLSESRHYNAVDADLRTVSLMSDFLRPKVPTEEALAMIPEDTDVICLYLSQDDSTLYIASRVLMPPQVSLLRPFLIHLARSRPEAVTHDKYIRHAINQRVTRGVM